MIDSAPVGRLVLDGGRLVPLQGSVHGRRGGGCCSTASPSLSFAVDEAGRLRGKPRLSAPGLFDADDPETARIAGESRRRRSPTCRPPLRRDDAALIEAAKAALRRALGKRLQKRPLVDVHLLRV